jgi:hypothetical protein
MVRLRPIEEASIRRSLEEVAVRAGHKVLMEVDISISTIIDNAQVILDQRLRPYYYIN